MFGVYFGKYLEGKGIITNEQYIEMISDSKNVKVKMGLLAVDAGYMTEKQAEEVNLLQQMQDMRFGDIAIEKGYLTEEQVETLLEKQGDEYLLFIQLLVERDILTLEEIQKEINAYKKAERFSALDIEAIKSGDVDKIVPIFTRNENILPIVKDYIALTARNIVRFVDPHFRMEKVEHLDEYTSNNMAIQEMDGEYKILTAFCGDSAGIRVIAEGFAREEFAEINLEILDILDATCEFLNCNNGIFATKLSHEDIDLDMVPPTMRDATTIIRSERSLYKIPFYVKNQEVDFIICVQSKWNII